MVGPVKPTYFLLFLPIFATGSIPESLGGLKKLTHLSLYRNQLTGHFFLHFWDGQSRTTNLIVAAFCLLLPQGASPSPWGTLGI